MKRVKRINFLNIPIDQIDKESAFTKIREFLSDGKKHQIVLLTLDKLLKARIDNEYNRCLRESSLILPVSMGIIRGVKFHRKLKLTRYNPYEFIIHLFSLIERSNKSIYLLGSEKEYLMEAEKNLKISFPGLKIIGRYSGYFNNMMEKNIIITIKKSSPALTIVGKGVPGGEKWIFYKKNDFNPGISIWIDNYIDIFAGKEKNISKGLFKIGLESLPGILRKPWKILKLFTYIYFKILVLLYKILSL